jgi:hypothetical protein
LEAVREEGRAASRAAKITRSRPLRPTPGVSPIGAASSRRSFLSVRTASSLGRTRADEPRAGQLAVAVRQGVRCWVAGVGLGYLLMSMDPYATDRVLTRSETFDIP